MDASALRWSIEVVEEGVYECHVRFSSTEEGASLAVDFKGRWLEKELPLFVPVSDKNHSRIDRPAEAIDQSWGRITMGETALEKGIGSLVVRSSGGEVEVLEVILHKL